MVPVPSVNEREDNGSISYVLHLCVFDIRFFWKWKSFSHVWLFVTPWTIESMKFSRPEYWRGSCPLLQGIFPTQGSNPGLLHCRLILYQLSHQRSPRILKWIACSFSRGSSWIRNLTGVSRISGRFFTSWATREALRIFWMWYQMVLRNECLIANSQSIL